MSDLAMLTGNALKERLSRGELAVSMSVRIMRSHEIGYIAANAGFDTLYVDLEHSVLSLETTALLCQAARAAGIVPLVRLPVLEAALIGRVLDGGAMGLILPHIESAATARAAVAAALYPPRGTRSVGTGQPLLNYRSVPATEACAALNESLFIAAMVESAAGLSAVNTIAEVEGVDMLFVGTHDLCADMGWKSTDDEIVAAAYAQVLAAASKHGKFVGAGGVANRPQLVKRLLEMGVRFISAGTDLGFISAGASLSCAVIRASEAPSNAPQ